MIWLSFNLVHGMTTRVKDAPPGENPSAINLAITARATVILTKH